MSPTANSFFAAKRAALAGHRRGVIDAGSVQFLVHIASLRARQAMEETA